MPIWPPPEWQRELPKSEECTAKNPPVEVGADRGRLHEAAVAAALADPNAELPVGSRRMTKGERAERIDTIMDALIKQVPCVCETERECARVF
jgi:hypothetical protein